MRRKGRYLDVLTSNDDAMLHKTAHRNHRDTPLGNARWNRKEFSCPPTTQIERGLFAHM